MLIGILAVVYFIVGYFISRKLKSTEDYFLAGRSLGTFPLVIALSATQLGGGFIIGTSREAYLHGYYGIIYIAGICLGLLLLSSGIAAKLRSFNISTTVQIFEDRYNSIFLKRFASLCSIISLSGIFAAQVIASKTLMLGLNTYNPYIFILFWMAIITYTMMGGLGAIVKNDIFQLSFIVLIFLMLFFVDISSNVCQALNVFCLKDITQVNWDLARVAGILFMPALYALIEQDLSQVFFAAKNSRIAVLAAFASSIFLLLFAFIPLYFGMKAKLLNIPLNLDANPLVSYFDHSYSSTIVVILTYGIFAAIISSANAVLCAISSNIVMDFNLTSLDKRHKLAIAKAVTFLVGLIGLGVSFYFCDLIRVLVHSYAVPVSSLLVSLLVAYYVQGKLCRKAAYTSVLFGFFSLTAFFAFNTHLLISMEIDALLFSLIGYLLGLMFCKL